MRIRTCGLPLHSALPVVLTRRPRARGLKLPKSGVAPLILVGFQPQPQLEHCTATRQVAEVA